MILKQEASLTSKEGLLLILGTMALFCSVDLTLSYITGMIYNVHFPVASVIPLVAGLVLGLPGAVGATLGNFILQLIALEGLQFNALDCLGVFLMAYFPFRLWFAYQPKKASFYVYNNRTFVKYIFVVFLNAFLATGLAHAARNYSDNYFVIIDAWSVFSNMFLFPTLLGIPLLMLWQKLSPVRYVRYKSENQSWLPLKAIKVLVVLNILYIVSILAGVMTGAVAVIFAAVGQVLLCLGCAIASKYEPHELETSNFHSISQNVIDDIVGGSAIIAVSLYIALMFYYHEYIVVLDSQRIMILFYSTIYLIVTMFCVGVYCVLLSLEANFVRRITALSKKAMAYEFSETATANVFEEGLNTEASKFNEVDVLQKTLAQADVDLRKYVANMTASNDERSKVEGQLAIAQSIQGGLLPDVNKLQKILTGYKLMVGFEPTEYVCGDMYDCYMLDDDHLMLLVADADAKGVPAALFMMITLALIKNNADIASPGKILEKVNRSLARRNNEMISVTMWLGVLELSTGKIKYANAVQNEVIIADSQGENDRILEDISGPTLGIIPEIDEFEEFEITLEPGEKLLVYTDGSVLCTNEAKESLGQERLLNSFKSAHSIEEVVDDIKSFVGNEHLEDDITLLWLEREVKEGTEAC